MLWDSKGSESAFSGTAMAVRCYESHPVLKLGKGRLYGGNAFKPVKTDADVYVVLQSGDMRGRASDPWEKQTRHEVQYAIDDMHAPENVTRFKKMVTWVCNQLHDGKTVHVGCIGGHGRTGTVLSAIIAEALGEKDAIQYVRKHYCKKAVESKAQVQFLMKHYNVSSVEPTKSGVVKMGNGSRPLGFLSEPATLEAPRPTMTAKRRHVPAEATKATKSFVAMASNRSLWKAKKKV
jgi:hypothetical protein